MTGVGWLAGMQYWCRRIDPLLLGGWENQADSHILNCSAKTNHFTLSTVITDLYRTISSVSEKRNQGLFLHCVYLRPTFCHWILKLFVFSLIILQWYDWKPELVVSHDFSWFSRSRPLFPDRIAAASHWSPQPLQDQIWGRSRRRQISVARWGGGEASGHLRPLRTGTQPSREASGFSRAGKGDDSRFPGNVVTYVYKGYMTADIL